MDILDFAIAGVAALFAGVVNAIAGGGTLITFPVLTMLGIPAVMANVTNTVALCPCYLSATLTQKKIFQTQKKYLYLFFPISLVGGIIGGILLLKTQEHLFRQLIPFLLLLASSLLAFQDPLKRWIDKHKKGVKKTTFISILPIALATVYGGYFGAGVGVILLSVLSITLDESLTALNVLKSAISLGCNVSAAIFFLFSGQVQWAIAGVMAVGALFGGVLGGYLASSIKASALRWIVVSIGFGMSIFYWLNN